MFTVTEKEDIEINEWRKSHKCKLRSSDHGIEDEIYVGAIGGSLTYSFTPTGLGTILNVECACGEKFSPTNFEDW